MTTETAGVHLHEIAKLAERQIELENLVATKEEELKHAKDLLRQLSENDLPEALTATGLSEVTLANGRKVTVEMDYHAAIPKAKKQDAFSWLRDHGFEGIIKRSVSFAFGRGDDTLADEFLEIVARKFPDVGYKDDETVHPQTLKAFVREQMQEGSDIPHDAFGIFVRRIAKIGIIKK